MKPTPAEALDFAILRAVACSYPRKPGAVIAGLPPEYREALKDLRPKDADVAPWVMGKK